MATVAVGWRYDEAMDGIELHGVTLEVAHYPGSADQAPLVFLHEGLGCVSLWTQRGRNWPAELCAATGRAGWVVSRRGYGRSDPVPDVRGPTQEDGFWRRGRHLPDYMHREAWQVLPALLERWRVSRPVLIGHSDGATIALLHASRHPVHACVALAPHVTVEDVALRAIAQARSAFEADGPGSLRERLSRHHRHVECAFWQWNDVWLSPAFRTFDIRPDCASLSSPVLLVQGVNDEYGTLDQLDQITARAPHAQTLVLAECGHSPHRDQPDRLTEAVVKFLHPPF